MQLGEEGMFEVNIGPGEDGLVGCKESPLAEVLKDAAEDRGLPKLVYND